MRAIAAGQRQEKSMMFLSVDVADFYQQPLNLVFGKQRHFPMVLICNGPEIVLQCGACGTEIKHVGYDPGQPWPAAEASGWRIAKGPREKSQVGTIAARNARPTRMS
jgi:hypothetical protein